MRERWRRAWDKVRAPRRRKKRARQRDGGSGPTSRWRRFIAGVGDASEVAKLVSLVLLVAGFVAIYVPGMRRWYEKQTMPTAWYNAVRLSDPWTEPPYQGARPGDYSSPAWNEGLNAELLYSLRDTMIYSSGVAIGREGPRPTDPVRYIHQANVCFYVRDVAFVVWRRKRLDVPDETVVPSRPSVVGIAQLEGRRGLDAHVRLLDLLKSELPNFEKDKCVGNSVYEDMKEDERKKDRRPICPRISVWAKAQKLSC